MNEHEQLTSMLLHKRASVDVLEESDEKLPQCGKTCNGRRHSLAGLTTPLNREMEASPMRESVIDPHTWDYHQKIAHFEHLSPRACLDSNVGAHSPRRKVLTKVASTDQSANVSATDSTIGVQSPTPVASVESTLKREASAGELSAFGDEELALPPKPQAAETSHIPLEPGLPEVISPRRRKSITKEQQLPELTPRRLSQSKFHSGQAIESKIRDQQEDLDARLKTCTSLLLSLENGAQSAALDKESNAEAVKLWSLLETLVADALQHSCDRNVPGSMDVFEQANGLLERVGALMQPEAAHAMADLEPRWKR
eukprot:gnl/TRDRNA2_/TRDRNA2_151711_c0_seq5.p1 gnl/TRDRNA2_/TRDRNA2_151711_c0~~gnl/TRDRNA2_/TRDRNA2_151711_c0_seq5.p1  ORF type:complete len:312 (+),score=46.83 gnl/TRDRNA2_/TRDRNA2_151711_c0_seq5:597-1532(+)